jgi:hypothetical protein
MLPPASEQLAALSPGSGVEQLAEGRQMYVMRCSGCHNLPLPDVHTADGWVDELDDMGKRASLSPEQSQAVLAYLQAVVRSLQPPAAP